MTGEGEDRFGDLGEAPTGNGDCRSAAERLEERDRTHPEPRPRRPDVPRPSTRYSWLIGIAFFLVVIVASTNSLPNKASGLRGPEPGMRLPAFAAPLATGPLEGDANVRQSGAGSGKAGGRPACELRSEQVVNLCELRKKPVVLTFIFDRGPECNPQVDRVERMRGRFPGVNFASVFFTREDRDEVRVIVRRRGWREPVAVDRDGAVANRYGVGGCPTTVFAYRGGAVMRTRLGPISESSLATEAQRLQHGPGRRPG